MGLLKRFAVIQSIFFQQIGLSIFWGLEYLNKIDQFKNVKTQNAVSARGHSISCICYDIRHMIPWNQF